MAKVPQLACLYCMQMVTGPTSVCRLAHYNGGACVLEYRYMPHEQHMLLARTVFLSDDSVWCYDCGGVVAVADG